MLTKRDLEQIGNLMDERFAKQDQRIDNRFTKELGPVRQDIRKIKKDVSTIIRTFDRDIIDLQKRTDRIELHLHLSPLT